MAAEKDTNIFKRILMNVDVRSICACWDVIVSALNFHTKY